MASEYHLSWPGHSVTLQDPAAIVAKIAELDERFANERRSVLVGIDGPEASLDVGLGVLHTAMWVTNDAEPGYVAVSPMGSDESVEFEFAEGKMEFPALAVVSGPQVWHAVAEYLETGQRPSSLLWQAF